MHLACMHQHPGTTLELVGNNVMSWKCVTYSSYGPFYQDIDVAKQCRKQYGQSAKAAYRNFSDPFSWYCYD